VLDEKVVEGRIKPLDWCGLRIVVGGSAVGTEVQGRRVFGRSWACDSQRHQLHDEEKAIE
jgi:hypothetical protein